MERRMGYYGHRVINPHKLSYDSFSLSPLKSNNQISMLSEKIEDISQEIKNKVKKRKEMQVLSNLVSLIDTVSSNSYAKRSNTPAPMNPEIGQILNSYQKQQEMMLSIFQNIEAGKNEKKNKYNTNNDLALENQYQKIKKDPEEIRKMLAELNFDDDGAEDYADKERKLKFDVNLSDEEKMRIINNINKAKFQANHNNPKLFRGISRFRIIATMVIFPIFLVSNMLEKRAKESKLRLSNMQDTITIYVDVGKSWVIKAMKTVIVSTINDQNMDLVLHNKDSEIKNQSINAKVIKLQVRINGILDGLETFTNEKDMVLPLRKFINNYTGEGKYVPAENFTPFELSRIEFHDFGGLVNQNEDKKKMMICFFFITKLLVKQVCLRPVEAGIPIIKGTKAIE